MTDIKNNSRAYYGIDVLYFKFIGFWQLLTEGVWANKITIFSIVYGLLFSAYVIMQFSIMFVQEYDFSIFTEKLSVNLTCLESVIKMLFYCLKRTSLLELLAIFRLDLLLSSKHSPSITDKILTSNISTVNGATKSFVIMIFTTVGIWNCMPLFKRYSSDESTMLQIMPSWYPIDVSYAPVNIIVYIFEFFVMIYCAALLYNVNCTFSALALTASAQFELLSVNMANIESNAENTIDKESIVDMNDEIKKDIMNILLRECLIDHQTLLRLLKQMEDVFNPIFLFQMLTSTFTICLVLFQLNFHLASGNDLPIVVTFKFIMYLVFGSMELLVYSWGGQMIYNKSEEIYWSLQKCGWHKGSHEFQTNVMIAMIRSQYPITLTAGKFYAVNLASFAQVIKASYSYFTFLHGSISEK
uniref:Odorant receptor n=1 Tax=Adelphocoris lineolatus TaxID=236346 RepID=A0A2I4PHJ7_ADELI|nr:olfactory receptor 24 [Adelphocoris lineolatus]